MLRTDRNLQRGIALLALAFLLAPPAWALSLADVAGLLAQRKEGTARFTEERFVGGIDGPLRAAGTLSFTAPDRFVRTTTEPRAESMQVDGNSLVLKRNGRTRQMALDAVPEVTALIEAVRGTLTGNVATLQRHFQVRVDGTPAQWTLLLLPRDQRLATQVRELKITGTQSDLRVVELWLAGGDRSVMSIEPLQVSRSVEPAPVSRPAEAAQGTR